MELPSPSPGSVPELLTLRSSRRLPPLALKITETASFWPDGNLSKMLRIPTSRRIPSSTLRRSARVRRSSTALEVRLCPVFRSVLGSLPDLVLATTKLPERTGSRVLKDLPLFDSLSVEVATCLEFVSSDQTSSTEEPPGEDRRGCSGSKVDQGDEVEGVPGPVKISGCPRIERKGAFLQS